MSWSGSTSKWTCCQHFVHVGTSQVVEVLQVFMEEGHLGTIRAHTNVPYRLYISRGMSAVRTKSAKHLSQTGWPSVTLDQDTHMVNTSSGESWSLETSTDWPRWRWLLMWRFSSDRSPTDLCGHSTQRQPIVWVNVQGDGVYQGNKTRCFTPSVVLPR